MHAVKRYFLVLGIYILFMLFSFKYSPLSDAINDPSYKPNFNGEKLLDISIKTIRDTFKEDSVTIRKILTYGIEQYLDVFDYPFCTVDIDLNSASTLQTLLFITIIFLTGWLFLAFQRVADIITGIVSHHNDGQVVNVIIKISYIFYIENIIGYIAQITIYWMQKILLSNPTAIFLTFFYKLFMFLFQIYASIGNIVIEGKSILSTILFIITLIMMLILCVVCALIAGLLLNLFCDLGGFYGVTIKFYSIFIGPYILVGIRLIFYLVWLYLNSQLLSSLSSIILFKEIIHLSHFGILYFVLILIIWKDFIDPIITELLNAILNYCIKS